MNIVFSIIFVPMEFDENNEVEEQEGDDAIEIYSKRAIWWFSMPSPLIGGVLLAINLYNAGYKKAVYSVLAFALFFHIAGNVTIYKLFTFYHLDMTKINVKNIDLDTQMKFLKIYAIGIAINIIAATILTRYFFKKYFPDDDYYPKSITKPLFITVMVLLIINYIGAGGL